MLKTSSIWAGADFLHPKAFAHSPQQTAGPETLSSAAGTAPAAVLGGTRLSDTQLLRPVAT